MDVKKSPKLDMQVIKQIKEFGNVRGYAHDLGNPRFLKDVGFHNGN